MKNNGDFTWIFENIARRLRAKKPITQQQALRRGMTQFAASIPGTPGAGQQIPAYLLSKLLQTAGEVTEPINVAGKALAGGVLTLPRQVRSIYRGIRFGEPIRQPPEVSTPEFQKEYEEFKTPPLVKGALEALPWLAIPGAQLARAAVAPWAKAGGLTGALATGVEKVILPAAKVEELAGKAIEYPVRAAVKGAKALAPEAKQALAGEAGAIGKRIKPKAKPPVKPPAVTKEPWEMTEREWEAFREPFEPKYAYSTLRGASGHTNAVNKLQWSTYGVKKIDPTTGMAEQVFHRDVIEKALSEGKPVPPEVLKDYPALMAKGIPSTGKIIPEKGIAPIPKIQLGKKGLVEPFRTVETSEGVYYGVGTKGDWAVVFKRVDGSLESRYFDNKRTLISFLDTMETKIKPITPSLAPTAQKVERAEVMKETQLRQQRNVIQGDIDRVIQSARVTSRTEALAIPKEDFIKRGENYFDLRKLSPQERNFVERKMAEIERVNTQIVEQVTEVPLAEKPPTPLERAVQPSEGAIVPPGAGKPPVEPSGKPIFPEIPGRRVPHLPETKELVDPSLAKADPLKAARIVRGRLQDASQGQIAVATAKLRTLEQPNVVNGNVIDPRIAATERTLLLESGKPSMAIQDVVEHYPTYQVDPALKPYFEEIRALSKESGNMLEAELKKYGKPFHRLKGEADWEYLHRLVKEVGDVTVEKQSKIFKPRYHELAGEAAGRVEAPIRYADPLEAITDQLRQSYGMVARLRALEYITPLTTTAKERVPVVVKDILVDANRKRIVVEKLQNSVNAALRGEQTLDVTVESIAKEFPDLAERLAKARQPKMKVGVRRIMATRQEALKGLQAEVGQLVNTTKTAFQEAKSSYREWLERSGAGPLEGVVPSVTGSRIYTAQEFISKTGKTKLVEGRDVADMVAKQFGYNRPGTLETILGGAAKYVFAPMRLAKASLDASFALMQNLGALGIDYWGLITGHPTAYWPKSVGKGIEFGIRKTFGKGKGIFEYMSRPENKTALQELYNAGLVPTSEFTEAASGVVGALGKVPKIGKVLGAIGERTYGAADQAYNGGRLVAVLEMGKAYLPAARAAGQVPQLAKELNLLTGAFSLRGMGVPSAQRAIASWGFFAPNYTASTFALSASMLKGGYDGKLARQAIIGLAVGGAAFYVATAVAAGQKPRLNPLPKRLGGDGGKWGTIKVGNEYIGIGGGLYGLARLLVNIAAAEYEDPTDPLAWMKPVSQYYRGKSGPGVSLPWDIISGRGYMGEPTRQTPFDIAKTVGQWGVPITMETVVQEGAVGGVASFFGMRAFPESLWANYEDKLAEIIGKPVDQISMFERMQAEKGSLELMKMKEAAQVDFQKRGYNPMETKFFNKMAAIRQMQLSHLQEATKKYQPGSELKDIIQNESKLRSDRIRQLQNDPRFAEVITSLEKKGQERTSKAKDMGWINDIAYLKYLDIVHDPKLILPTGEYDFDTREKALTALESQVGPEVWRQVKEWLSQDNEELPKSVQLYYTDQEKLKDYWKLSDIFIAKYPPELQQIWTNYKNTTDAAQKQAMRRLMPGIPEIESRLRYARERYRRAHPDVDAALRRWGYLGPSEQDIRKAMGQGIPAPVFSAPTPTPIPVGSIRQQIEALIK